MEGLLNIKRTELAEMEKKLALEKEQLNLDVAKSIFADENAAFYKKLHAFFTTRVTKVNLGTSGVFIELDADEDGWCLSFEEDEDEWNLYLTDSLHSHKCNRQTFCKVLEMNPHLELCIFFGAYKAFITKYLTETNNPYFTLAQFQARWRK